MKAHAKFLHNRMRRRGVLLILTLWMVTVLSLIAYSLAYEMRLEVRLTKLKKDNLLAYQLAKAGVAKAVCDLKNDMVIDRAEGSEEFDAEGDVWKFYEDKVNIPLGAGTFSVRIIDEESLLNLNSISPFVMEKLALYFLGDGEDAEENALKIAQAVQDWRDADDTSISDQGITERQLYRQLIAEDWGIRGTDAELSEQIFYRIKNDVFTTVEELLDVYGVTP
ncbi:MAG TPA: type II secretion system protein GspK, partial [Candidatus Sumerlaeota bacterium]|nr:type II secretion system protein GspK [Candidatus Sumerlaeota bacterium]